MDYGKNRQWTAVLYNENMLNGWHEDLDTLVQLPYAYCVHDKGLALESGEHRKVHTHMILVWPAPTTYKHACEVFNRLSAPGKTAFSKIEPVYSARQMYDYLIHDTADCRKKGKYLFPQDERKTGNNYDIGAYEQVSQQDKNEMFDKLTDMVLANEIQNYADFVIMARVEFPEERELVRDVVRAWSGYFERLIKGVYLRGAAEMQEKRQKKQVQREPASADPDGSHEVNEINPAFEEILKKEDLFDE